MARRLTISGLAVGAVLAATPVSLAAPEPACTSDAMVVFDGSGSMAETGFDNTGIPRIFDARQAVRRAIPQVAEMRRMGLIVYGPGRTGGCGDIALHFAPRAAAGDAIVAAIDALAPAGQTPLTHAVQIAAEVLEYRTRSGVIVLVTDGRETCGGAPCALADAFTATARDLTVHVIGFRMTGDLIDWLGIHGWDEAATQNAVRCLADRTGGQFVSTETVDELTAALLVTLDCPRVSTGPRSGDRTLAG